MKNEYAVKDGIATVKLTRGKSMLVDEADLPLIAQFRWCAYRGRTMFYAVTAVRRNGCWTTLLVHRLLMGLDFGDPREVDHLDGDGLNNLRGRGNDARPNLRITDNVGNARNLHGKRPSKRGVVPTSARPGVYRSKGGAWQAQIWSTGRLVYLGRHATEQEAADAYIGAKAVRDAGGSYDDIKATWSAACGKQPRKCGMVPTSAHLGVCWNKAMFQWHAQIKLAGHNIYLGCYDDERDAANAYLRAKAIRDTGGSRVEIEATRRIA